MLTAICIQQKLHLMSIIKYPKICLPFIFFVGLQCAFADTLTIEDFDSYTDTTAMQVNVTTFGPADPNGFPELDQTEGVNKSNAAKLKLSWTDGDNANLSLRNLNPAASNIKSVSKIQSSIRIETADGKSAATTPTRIKLAIEGTNKTIWQTKGQFAVQPGLDKLYRLDFNVSSNDMERVENMASFTETIADIQSIRFRFENDVQANVVEEAYIDSIVLVTDFSSEPSTGTIIELGMASIPGF